MEKKYTWDEAFNYFVENGIEGCKDIWSDIYEYAENYLDESMPDEELNDDEVYYYQSTLDKILEKLKERQEEIEERESMYDYDSAVSYLENNGIGCDPCSDLEGEYVCDLLDDMYDAQNSFEEPLYEESTLDYIIKRAKEYLEEIKEEEEEEEEED